MKKQHQITAIIKDKRGKILSVGQNSYCKSHPLQAKHAKAMGEEYKIWIHAEISAITRCKDLSKAHSIEVFRYDDKGKPMLAKPCPICQSAIAATKIKLIIHT